MTSGSMNCPKCGTEFQYAGYENGLWVEHPEPWECPKCKSSIITDNQKGWGLTIVKSEVRNGIY